MFCLLVRVHRRKRGRASLGRSRSAGAVGHSASLVRTEEAAKNGDRVCLDLGDLHRAPHLAEFAATLRLVDSCVEAAQVSGEKAFVRLSTNVNRDLRAKST